MLHELPTTPYSLDDLREIIRNERLITNIFRRITLSGPYALSRLSLFGQHTIKDAQTPEGIAQEAYGSVGYWWVPLVINPRLVNQAEWPMTHHELDHWIDVNYGNRQYDLMPHERGFGLQFLLNDGTYVSHHTLGEVEPVDTKTYRDHIVEENDAKRVIRMLNAQHLQGFVREFGMAVRGD